MGRFTRLIQVPYDAARFAYMTTTRAWREVHHPEIPNQPPLKVFSNVCLDELVLAMMTGKDVGFDVSHESLSGWSQEMHDALAVLEANDCLGDPASFHLEPPPIDDMVREPGSMGPLKFEVLKFESAYQALPGFPGTHRWQSLTANQHASAFLLEHRDGPRPWLVNLHPFGGGRPIDLILMRSLKLHRKLGYNVVHPVYPLHGTRHLNTVDLAKTILSYDLINTIHFFAQSMWDIRRVLGWVRNREPTSIALHGISLGAYMGSLLAGLEEVDRAILGVGAVNIPAAKDFVLSKEQHNTIEGYGLIGEASDTLMRVISPTVLECRIPHERRFIYGGVGDRFAPGGTYELWKTWEEPSVHWHAGGHISGIMAPSVWRYIFEALSEEGAGSGSDRSSKRRKRKRKNY